MQKCKNCKLTKISHASLLGIQGLVVQNKQFTIDLTDGAIWLMGSKLSSLINHDCHQEDHWRPTN